MNKTDVKNVIHELNILRRRCDKYMKIIESQNRSLRQAMYSSMTQAAAISYYRKGSDHE